MWLTPGLDWRREYAGWPALGEARVRRPRDARDRLAVARRRRAESRTTCRSKRCATPSPSTTRTATTACRSTMPRQFDTDLRGIFNAATDAPDGEQADVVHSPALPRDRVAHRVLDRREPERRAIAHRSSRATRRRARSARRRARGVDADRADGVRHRGRHESSLHAHAAATVARQSRAGSATT